MGQRYQSLHVHSHASCFHGKFVQLFLLIENKKLVDNQFLFMFRSQLAIKMTFFSAFLIPLLDRYVQLIHPANKKNRSCG